MCGIVGYIGPNVASDFLLEGLRRLEYRGYDSSGIVTIESDGELSISKTTGRIDDLSRTLQQTPHGGNSGVGHTRWATHGPATDANAHPHVGGGGELALVHNGVIENFRELREALEEKGYEFKTETDSEAVAHLIADELRLLAEGEAEVDGGRSDDPYATPIAAVQSAAAQLRGTYGLAVVFKDWPDAIIACRLGSPLVLGIGQGEHFVASDGSPLVGHTDKIVYLADNELAVVTRETIRVLSRDEGPIRHDVKLLEIESSQVELGGFPHYMLKEIFEQPESLRNALRGRLDRDEATAVFGGLNLNAQQLRGVDRLVLTACGTSWHSALVAEYMIEAYARIPVEVEYASELRYRNSPLSPQNTMTVRHHAVRRDGRHARRHAGDCSGRDTRRSPSATSSGSSIAREADGGVYLYAAGSEIGVASARRPSLRSVMVLNAVGPATSAACRHLSASPGGRTLHRASS